MISGKLLTEFAEERKEKMHGWTISDNFFFLQEYLYWNLVINGFILNIVWLPLLCRLFMELAYFTKML